MHPLIVPKHAIRLPKREILGTGGIRQVLTAKLVYYTAPTSLTLLPKLQPLDHSTNQRSNLARGNWSKYSAVHEHSVIIGYNIGLLIYNLVAVAWFITLR